MATASDFLFFFRVGSLAIFTVYVRVLGRLVVGR